jgi:hemolysin activation/secretion protein
MAGTEGIPMHRGLRLCVLALAAAPVLHAAEPSREDVLQAQEQQRQQTLREQAAGPAPVLRAVPGAGRQPVVAGELPCFVLHTLDVQGPPGTGFWLLHRALLDEWQPARGLCLGQNALAALHFNLNARLQQEGWLTSRLDMPAQNLAAGALRVEWQPGVIESVRSEHGGTGTGTGTGLASLRLRPGQPLNVAALDQAADLYNRLPSLGARLLVLPGSSAQSHHVVAEVQAGRAWRSTLALDNTSAREYGRLQATWQGALDRPSALLGLPGLLDQMFVDVALNAEHPTNNHHNAAATLQYTLPLGDHRFDLNVHRGRFGRAVQGTSVRFVNRGADHSAGARWTWAAWRTERSKWAVWAGLDQRRARRDIDDVELVLQRRRTVALEAGLSFWSRALLAGHSVDVTAEASHGRTRRRGALQAFEPGPGPAMQEQRVAFGLNAPLALLAGPPAEGAAPGPVLSLRLQAQSVLHPLTSADLPIIGTRYAVRGFDGGAALQGRHAAVLRTDLRLPPFAFWGGQAQAAPYLGLDVGTLRAPAAGPGTARSLSGVVAGLQTRADRLAAEFSVAMPLRKAPGSHATRCVPTLRLSLDL